MTVFLLSPAKTNGKRASMLLRPGARFDLALQLQSPAGAELGDVFSFASALYFRGKLTYARAFGSATHVITAGRGLLAPDTRITIDDLHAMAAVPIDEKVAAYAEPLKRDVTKLAKALRPDERVVILGSIASKKYTSILSEAFGPRLLFPKDFVGRGDMSRGGLLLRSVRSGEELEYVALASAVLKGARAAKLPRLR